MNGKTNKVADKAEQLTVFKEYLKSKLALEQATKRFNAMMIESANHGKLDMQNPIAEYWVHNVETKDGAPFRCSYLETK